MRRKMKKRLQNRRSPETRGRLRGDLFAAKRQIQTDQERIAQLIVDLSRARQRVQAIEDEHRNACVLLTRKQDSYYPREVATMCLAIDMNDLRWTFRESSERRFQEIESFAARVAHDLLRKMQNFIVEKLNEECGIARR